MKVGEQHQITMDRIAVDFNVDLDGSDSFVHGVSPFG